MRIAIECGWVMAGDIVLPSVDPRVVHCGYVAIATSSRSPFLCEGKMYWKLVWAIVVGLVPCKAAALERLTVVDLLADWTHLPGVDQKWLPTGIDDTLCKPMITNSEATTIDATEPSPNSTGRVPGMLIVCDDDGVLAERALNGTGDVEIHDGPRGKRSPSLQDTVTIKIEMGGGDGILQDATNVTIGSVVTNLTSGRIDGGIEWIVETDEGAPVATVSNELMLAAKDRQHIACTFAPPGPGFYRVRCTFHGLSVKGQSTTSRVLGYRPRRIQTESTREPDFDAFWERTLEELAAVKPEFEMTPCPSRSTETHEAFEVSMRSLDGITVKGWYERPKSVGPHPAVIRVPGYRQAMQTSGTKDSWAVFSFNIRAHGNSQKDVSGTPEDYWIRGLDDKDKYFYRGAYCDCIRAVDFVASRAEVDTSRIAITGVSQGGGLSLVTAGLDQRISLCASDVPFLCNWERYFRTSSWPEMDSWIGAERHRTWERTLRTLSYFDVLNLVEKIKCPVLLGIGLQDETCPPVTIFAVFNKLSCEKNYRIYPEAGHRVEDLHHIERREWLVRHFATVCPNESKFRQRIQE